MPASAFAWSFLEKSELPNESRLSGGQTNSPTAQLLHYLIFD